MQEYPGWSRAHRALSDSGQIAAAEMCGREVRIRSKGVVVKLSFRNQIVLPDIFKSDT